MSQQNTTPETSTYVLGRGKMFFSEISATNGRPLGYRFVGNCPEVTGTVDSENYEHYRSTSGLKQKDLDIIIEQSINWSASLENLDKENMALFFSADKSSTFINPAITGFSDQVLVADGEMVSAATDGLWYQLLDASNQAATGITTTNAISLASTNDSPVALVKDTDYKVDAETGRVFFYDTAKIQAIITGDEGVTATLTADASAPATAQYGSGSKGETNLAVRFELINAQTDTVELIFFMHKAGVSANGDWGAITDEAGQLPITISVEQNDNYDNPMDYQDLRA